MRKPTNREKVLSVALAAACVALWFGLTEERGSPGLPVGGPDADAGPFDSPPRIEMDLLQVKRSRLDADGRDLFRYREPRTRIEPPQQPEDSEPSPADDSRVTRAIEEPSAPGVTVPPKPPFAYLGYLGPKDRKIAVFEGKSGLLMARIGDSVGNRFALLEFRYGAVVLGHLDRRFRGETATLRWASPAVSASDSP